MAHLSPKLHIWMWYKDILRIHRWWYFSAFLNIQHPFSKLNIVYDDITMPGIPDIPEKVWSAFLTSFRAERLHPQPSQSSPWTEVWQLVVSSPLCLSFSLSQSFSSIQSKSICQKERWGQTRSIKKWTHNAERLTSSRLPFTLSQFSHLISFFSTGWSRLSLCRPLWSPALKR